MRHRTVAAVLLAVLLAASVAGAGIVQGQSQTQSQFVRGEPELSTFAPEATLAPGETTQFELQIANDGDLQWGTPAQRDEVTTARSVEVELEEGDAPFTIETGRQSVGSIPDGTVRTVPIAVTVPADADPGTYSLDVELRYSHVALSDPNSGVVQERSRRVTRSVDVTIEDRPRFDLRNVQSDARVGDSGTVAIEVENDGSEPARDVVVALESGSPNVGFGEARRDTGRIDRLDPGETAVIEYDVAVRERTTVRNYSLEGTVQFTDPDGIRGVEDGLGVGFRPLTSQGFDVSVEESTLRVGETGTIVGTLRNDGPVAVEDVAIGLGDGQLEPQSGGYAVGDLAVGETATFRLRVAVPETTAAAPQRIDLATNYRIADGRDRSSIEPVGVPVGEQEFAVTLEESTLRVGETGTIAGTVRNDGPVAAEDVALTLGEGQFQPRSRTYAVGDLDAGETADFRFRAVVPEGVDAVPQRIDVTTTYRTAAGNDRSVVDPIRVPVAERRDAVSVSAVDPEFAADESGTLELDVTNQRDVEIRDVRVRLSVEEPLESDFRTAVVSSLAPGETERVAFDLDVDGDAPRSQYPAVVEIEYVDPDDEPATSRPATVAVQVTEVDDAAPVVEILVGVGVLVVVVAGGWWFYGRRLV